MRHRIHGKQLNRDSDHRRAMLRNLAAGLFEHGQIETTMPKAKAVQPLVERIITIARRGGLTARRRIEQMVNDRRIHAWVADPNVPDSRKHNAWFDLPSEDQIEFNRYGEVRKAPRLVQHILTSVAPRFDDREGGYTRIVKLGKHRLGDGTDLVLLQLVGEEEGPQLGGTPSRRRRQKDRRVAFAESVAPPPVSVEETEPVAAEEAPEVTDVEETSVAAAEEAPQEDAAEDDPQEDTPAEDAPEEGTPTQDAPTEEAPVEDAPQEDAPAEEAATDDAASDEDPPADPAEADEAPKGDDD